MRLKSFTGILVMLGLILVVILLSLNLGAHLFYSRLLKDKKVKESLISEKPRAFERKDYKRGRVPEEPIIQEGQIPAPKTPLQFQEKVLAQLPIMKHTEVGTFTVSPDSKWFVVSSGQDTLLVINLEDATSKEVTAHLISGDNFENCETAWQDAQHLFLHTMWSQNYYRLEIQEFAPSLEKREGDKPSDLQFSDPIVRDGKFFDSRRTDYSIAFNILVEGIDFEETKDGLVIFYDNMLEAAVQRLPRKRITITSYKPETRNMMEELQKALTPEQAEKLRIRLQQEGPAASQAMSVTNYPSLPNAILSPNGAYLFYIVSWTDGAHELYCLDVQTRKTYPVTDNIWTSDPVLLIFTPDSKNLIYRCHSKTDKDVFEIVKLTISP